MLLQTTFVVVVFCVLVDNSSTYQVREYRAVRSDNGQDLCATSPPNKTVNGVAIRSKCFILCDRGCQSPCQGINYRRTTEVCELFYYEPCSYDLQPDCVNFMLQVVNNQRFDLRNVSSICETTIRTLYIYIIKSYAKCTVNDKKKKKDKDKNKKRFTLRSRT